MKTWAYVASAAAAVSAALVVVFAFRRSREGDSGAQVPRIIADCQEKVDRIERELHRLQAGAG